MSFLTTTSSPARLTTISISSPSICISSQGRCGQNLGRHLLHIAIFAPLINRRTAVGRRTYATQPGAAWVDGPGWCDQAGLNWRWHGLVRGVCRCGWRSRFDGTCSEPILSPRSAGRLGFQPLQFLHSDDDQDEKLLIHVSPLLARLAAVYRQRCSSDGVCHGILCPSSITATAFHSLPCALWHVRQYP